MRTKLSLTALATVTALLLSGCYKTDMAAQVTSDGKVSGTWVFAMSNEALASMQAMDPNGDGTSDEKDKKAPKLTPKQYAEKVIDLDEATESAPAGVTAARWSGKGYTGVKFTMTKVTFAKFNRFMTSDDGPAAIKLARTKDGQVSFRQVIEAYEAFPGMAAPTYKVKLTFPGQVVSTNGKVSGTTVTWSGKPTAKEKVLTATAAAR